MKYGAIRSRHIRCTLFFGISILMWFAMVFCYNCMQQIEIEIELSKTMTWPNTHTHTHRNVSPFGFRVGSNCFSNCFCPTEIFTQNGFAIITLKMCLMICVLLVFISNVVYSSEISAMRAECVQSMRWFICPGTCMLNAAFCFNWPKIVTNPKNIPMEIVCSP